MDSLFRIPVGGTTKVHDVLSMAPNAAWFRAKQGDLEAQYVLAQCYLHAIQQERSLKQALLFFGKAASHGHVEAQFHYGLQFLDGVGMPKKELGQAVFWFTKAAQAGHAEAMYTLGMMSLQGNGMIESEQIALDWFVKSSALSFKEAQYRYATFLERGELMEQDLQKALFLYIKAGEQDHPEAQHRAALLFSKGVSLEGYEDKGKVRWHTMPSVATWAKGFIHALRLKEARPFSTFPSVVSWYATRRTLIDWTSAAHWHARAAKLNFVPSKYALAVQLQDGLGLLKDEAHSFILFREAALGHTSDEIGALNEVQYFCPRCGHWNRNESTKEKPKGDARCSKCRDDRIFSKNLKNKSPSSPIVRSPPPMNVNEQKISKKMTHDRPGATEQSLQLDDPDYSHTILLPDNLKKVIRLKELKYFAEPQIMHILAEVGDFLQVTVVNESNQDSGIFYVEFYVSGVEENVAESGFLIYGGRVLIQNVSPRTSQIVKLQHCARCPLDAKAGDGKVWVGIKPFPFTDPPGEKPLNWRRNAVAGKLNAIQHLADASWHGKGIDSDLREAIRWYRMCQGAGSGDLGLISPQSLDVLIMHCGPIPIDLCPMTSLKGYKPAWLAFALILDRLKSPQHEPLSRWHQENVGENHSLFPDFGAPASWMYMAAEHGNIAQAQQNLAVWYVQGQHVPRSMPQAWFWFKKAADQGLADAQYNLALLYQTGEAIEVDENKAAELFTMAVEQGHIPSHLSLGVCYLEGKGVQIDLDKAIYLLSVPAHKGWDIAQFNLGCLYSRGWGVPKDPIKSAEWHHRAALQGHREAQVCFAKAVYRGQGVPRDLEQAATLFRKSAEQGHPQAQFNLGVMYSRGEGVDQDIHNAAVWWEKAAQQGHALAQFELGEYHLAQSRIAFQDIRMHLRERLILLSSNRDIFEKYAILGRFEAGSSAALCEESVGIASESLDRRQFLRILEDFQVIPKYMPKKELQSVLQFHANNKDSRALNFPSCQRCITAIAKKLKLNIAEQKALSPVKDSGKHSMFHDQLIATFKEQTNSPNSKSKMKEALAVNLLFHELRGTHPPMIPTFSKTHEHLRGVEEKAAFLKSKMKKELSSLKYQLWRAKDASERFAKLRAETDALLVGGQSDEINHKRAIAERVRLSEVNAKAGAKVIEITMKKTGQSLQHMLGIKTRIENELQVKYPTDQSQQVKWFEEVKTELECNREEMLRMDEDLEGQKNYHFQHAAKLFLDSSQRNNIRAQYNLGHLFSCDEPLPEDWIPATEEDIDDKDVVGLRRFRQDIETLRRTEEIQRNSVFSCFSFQKSSSPVVQSAESKEFLRRQAGKQGSESKHSNLRSSSYDSIPLDESLEEQTQEVREFKQWRALRFRKERSAFWFMESAKNGHAGSQYEVGMMYLSGHNPETPEIEAPYIPLPKDVAKAAKWLLKAAEHGDPKAQYQYALCIYSRVFEHEDTAVAFEWMCKSCEQELPEAMLYLAKCYQYGLQVERDVARAASLFQKAAEKGYVEAQVAWADVCLAVDSDNSQKQEGLFWLHAAADEHPQAKLQLARCFQEGIQVEQDEEYAVQLLLEASECHAASCLQLGICHHYGIGVQRDLQKAMRWYLKAAEGGDMDGMMNVSLCYSQGIGIAEDQKLARSWLKRAAELGCAKAVAMISMQKRL